MVSHTTAMAKFARPNTKGALLRDQLFKTLNGLHNIPVIWLQSPAGAGKTTLISSYFESLKIPCLWYQVDEGDGDLASFFYYLQQAVHAIQSGSEQPSHLPLLTSEYQSSLPFFTQRFFEQLFRELGAINRLVFDNYQAVSHKADFHRSIIHGLAAIPPERQVFLISREAPTGDYIRLRANGAMVVLTWDQLRLSLDESRKIAALRCHHPLDEEQMAKLHDCCEGWAAGLVLLLEATRSLNAECLNMSGNAVWDDVFNYFAGEVFEHMAPEIQDLLLKTAYLPKVHALHAARLTGSAEADTLLLSLSRNQYFVTPYSHEDPVYHYHQLFRQFLITETKKRLDGNERTRIRQLSARLMLESGNTEEAAALFIRTNDWTSLSDIILTHAQSLIEQGRQETLLGWIDCLPASDVGQSSWIAYWKGVCMLTADPLSSRNCLATAFEGFKQADDAAGAYLAWAGVIDTFIYVWGDMTLLDRWIEEIQPLLGKYPLPQNQIGAKVTAAMFCALMYRRPQHPDMEFWEESLNRIIQEVQDAHLKIMLSSHLMLYYSWWVGGQEKAAFLVDILKHALEDEKVTHLHYIVWRSMEGTSLWMRNRFQESHQALAEGLALAEETGIHLWDFMLLANMVYWHLCQQKYDEAETYLARMRFVLDSHRDMDISHFHFQSAYARLCRGNLSLALEHINAAIAFAHKSGCLFPYYFYLTGKADILIEAGEYAQADGLLQEAFEFGRQMHSSNLIYQFFWLQALMYYKQGDLANAHQHLRAYLQNSRQNGTVNHAWWRPTVMALLFVEALRQGIEVNHVQRLIREHGMHPPEGIPVPENWPFAIRIFTLGGFSLTVDGKPAATEIKGKSKPLEMLKILAIQNDMYDASLASALWPDADGDAALRSFAITLHRLRKRLGHPEAVILKDRHVSLNRKMCWADVWMLRDLLDRAAKIMGSGGGSPNELMRLTAQLQAAYKGPLLTGEEAYWAEGPRRHLHDRWTYIAKQLGDLLEQENRWGEADQLYEHTLHMDPSAEWACQGAMRCSLHTGCWGKALAAYGRFKQHLDRHYANPPSPQTEALRKQMHRFEKETL